eukprot:TRINITY_DN50680_c0_g1_i1.p1 TRINITY_DN50680_c0_g1~~TRINITY_DN50680_c0_g1_i1.p1  ORF type:complete len:272 (+),score=108.74 TRINITY_DN50680_c0_g1_i1:127-942(+)
MGGPRDTISPVPFQDEHFNLGDDNVRANVFSANDGFLASACILSAVCAATGADLSHVIAAGLTGVISIAVKGASSFWITTHLQNEREKEELEKEEHHLRQYPEEEEEHLMDLLTRQVCQFSTDTREAIRRDIHGCTGEQRKLMELRMHAELELGLDPERADEEPTLEALKGALWTSFGGLLPLLPWVMPFTSTPIAAASGTVLLSLFFVAFIGFIISRFASIEVSAAIQRQLVTFLLCVGVSYFLGGAVHYFSTHVISIDVEAPARWVGLM